MDTQFTKAVRRSVPMLISLAGVSGSGKTYSALLVASGLAGPNGKVGFIDTENQRGSLYADSPGVMAALPNGYEIIQLTPPFSPARYIECIQAAEDQGITVLIIDSASHEWEGIDGCCEIAEKNKLRGLPNWSMAKREHKKFMNYLLSTNLHLVFCLRAREKVKIVEVVKENGKKATEVVPIGIQAIAEKSFVFEMLVSLRVEEETHFAVPIKVPEPLVHLFPGGKLLTREDGERIRKWNEGGRPLEDNEQLKKRSRAIAELGTEAYREFFVALPKAQQKALAGPWHDENKFIAEQADRPTDELTVGEQPDGTLVVSK